MAGWLASQAFCIIPECTRRAPSDLSVDAADESTALTSLASQDPRCNSRSGKGTVGHSEYQTGASASTPHVFDPSGESRNFEKSGAPEASAEVKLSSLTEPGELHTKMVKEERQRRPKENQLA